MQVEQSAQQTILQHQKLQQQAQLSTEQLLTQIHNLEVHNTSLEKTNDGLYGQLLSAQDEAEHSVIEVELVREKYERLVSSFKGIVNYYVEAATGKATHIASQLSFSPTEFDFTSSQFS